MKKILFLATMMAALFASCQKESFSEPTIEASGDFTASFADTRTELNGTAVVWCEEDLLTIFTKTAHNRKYQVKELSDDGRTATFGYVSFTGNNDTKITTNYALYPYDADATLTAGVVTTTLQPTQTYNAANGSLGYALMVARSSNTNFSFINAGSLLRFKLSKIVPDEFTLNSIKVASANNNIAGEVTINLGSSDAKAFVSSNGVKEITLSDINYDVTTDVKEFYIAMPSVSFEDKDLTVTFVFEEGEKVFKLPAFDLEQGKIKSIEYKINDAEDFTGGTPDSGEIVPVAKPAANEIWYTTTDGEMALVYNDEDIVSIIPYMSTFTYLNYLNMSMNNISHIGVNTLCQTFKMTPFIEYINLNQNNLIEVADKNELKEGDVLNGIVKNIRGYGAFVEIGGGLVGLLPIENISVSRIKSPAERFKIGQKINVMIKSIEKNENRVFLTYKELLGSWEENVKDYQIGTTVKGIVREVEKYKNGIFVELKPNLVGLAEYKDGYTYGQTVDVYIKKIQYDKKKIKLILV